MNYPRIYSLSTVGMLKHYNSNYLFHPVRTDFVGANGIGKSIITDLLQMLFIYDSKDIRFGTEGMDKRSIETLPYGTKIAYCFLNVEIGKDKFFIIGITINSQSRRKITPFVITKQSDLNLPKEQLALNINEILFAEHIIQQDRIPNLADFSKILFETKDLYLTHFNSKEDIQTYYSFLYSKEILSLNLAIEKNYKAFLKVIQSFSKVKTFTLDEKNASDSLKEFLFENADTDIKHDFNVQQESLEKILREYKRLDSDIKSLGKKQNKLLELIDLEKQYIQNLKSYKTAEISWINQLKEGEQTKIKKLKDDLFSEEKKLEQIRKALEKLPDIEKTISNELAKANSNFDNYTAYEQLKIEVIKLEKNISDLESLVIPHLHEECNPLATCTEIKSADIKEITSKINSALPYIQKYETVSKIEEVQKVQSEKIHQLKSSFEAEKAQKKNLLDILEKQQPGSLIHWYISHQQTLTRQQLQTLLHFASVSTSKVNNPKSGTRIVEPEKLFNEFLVEPSGSEKDYWLKSGAFSEYIAFEKDAVLFEDKQSLVQSVQTLVIKLKKEIAEIDDQLVELSNISNAQEYDKSILKEEFDLFLIEYSNVKKIKEGISFMLQLDNKITLLQTEKANKNQEIQCVEDNFPKIIQTKKLEEVKSELRSQRTIWNNRQNKISNYATKINTEKPTLTKSIQDNNNKLTDTETLFNEYQKKNDALLKDYFEKFEESISECIPVDKKILDELETKSDEAFKEYQRSYVSVIPLFEETKDDKNVAVNLEINNGYYSFRVLEEALLGNKVKSTDEITSALNEANQNRLNMADGIRDNMVKVFKNTIEQYQLYKKQINAINTFFTGRKISKEFFFKLRFDENLTLRISLIDEMIDKIRLSAKQGELPFDQPVSELIEEFFRQTTRMNEKVPIDKLLNPESYFSLSAKLTDQNDKEIPGSTGETYTAIALLGIARLSVVQKEERDGLKFIILEELGNLDKINFNTFPLVAKEFKYQIITMAPHILNMGLENEWYSHHLIKGKPDKNINFSPCMSYFKTKERSEDLHLYLSRL